MRTLARQRLLLDGHPWSPKKSNYLLLDNVAFYRRGRDTYQFHGTGGEAVWVHYTGARNNYIIQQARV